MSIERARAAATRTFPERTIVEISDLNRGRGVFSEVYRVAFSPTTDEPDSVAVKLAVAGANGDAARRSGGYGREALAYQLLLPHLDVMSPRCHAVIEDPLGPTFVLDDLSDARVVDQLDGLGAEDAAAVAESLGRLHTSSVGSVVLEDPNLVDRLRTNTVASLDPASLLVGLDSLTERWGHAVDDDHRTAYRRLVDRHAEVAERFAAAGPAVLCHGDPRADNLVFARTGGRPRPILFDWQQIARQPGVGDLAWLTATSLEPSVRRAVEPTLLAAYRQAASLDDRHYRIGFALPGLAVLLLAQRVAVDARTEAFIATSLRRVGQALVDWDVARG